MQAYPNAPYPAGGPPPVRYMVPNGYRQPYPPFVNQSFDRFAVMPTTYRAPAMTRPVHYPPSYGPGQGPGGALPQPVGQPGGPATHGKTVVPNKTTTQNPKQGQQPLFNPNGNKKDSVASAKNGSKTPVVKKGPKEFKDSAFTIEPSENDAIRGLVSNDDINNLLKHKGTKVKVSKIYRITKTKPEEISDDEDPTPPPPPPKATRPRSPSEDSYCSQCDERPCSQCLDQRPPHVYDDCPQCRAQAQQTHFYDDCPQCREERSRELSKRR